MDSLRPATSAGASLLPPPPHPTREQNGVVRTALNNLASWVCCSCCTKRIHRDPTTPTPSATKPPAPSIGIGPLTPATLPQPVRELMHVPALPTSSLQSEPVKVADTTPPMAGAGVYPSSVAAVTAVAVSSGITPSVPAILPEPARSVTPPIAGAGVAPLVIPKGREIIQKGDLFAQEVEALVNPANPECLGGSGVDGWMHQKAGPGLLAECLLLPIKDRGERCPTGSAVITGAHDLTTEVRKHIIHTVGPVYFMVDPKIAAQQLTAAYTNSLLLAKKNGIRSIAFPLISSGIYGYPVDEAAQVAVKAIQNFLRKNPGSMDSVRIIVLADVYSTVIAAVEDL